MNDHNETPVSPSSSPSVSEIPEAETATLSVESASEIPEAETVAAEMGANLQALPPPATLEEEARARIASMEREAKALGTDPSAALLFHEIGLLWEDPLKNPRNAAVAFQNAYKVAPRFLSNIRAARRLFADVGNWQMVVQLLDAELLVCEDARQRPALLLEKAAILEERLSREDDAARVYAECLAAKPRDLSLLIQLEGVYAGKQDFSNLVEVQRLLAEALEDPALKAHYLTNAGFILEERLKDPDGASVAFRAAFSLDRRDILLLSAMKQVSERSGNTEELLSVLAAEADLLGAQAAPTFLQISKVYEKLDRKEDALAALLAARRASNDPLVLAELARIYEAQRRFEDLADVLLSWVNAINDESEMVAINLRLAALYEEELRRDEDAIARYRAILTRVPNHVQALAGLGKLYFRTQNWEGLLNAFEMEVQSSDDNKLKAAKTYKAAEVLEERLGRVEDAIGKYSECLQLQPGYLPAQKALSRLYEKQNRHAELVAMYEQDLLQTADRDQLISTLNKIAVIYEDRLNDLDHAIDCMTRILDLAPDHLGTIRNLARLYERAGKWRELIEHHEREAGLVGDTKQVLSLHHRNAEILEEQLQDRAGAISAYERLLSLSPSYLPALKALGRLYAQESQWDQLIKMYRAESEIASSPEAAAGLIYKIGELNEHKQKNESEAIASYQEVLTLAPNYFPSLRALARIYRNQQAWESLIEVLRAEAANRTDPVERANAIFHAAAIWEDHLNRPDNAIDGYQECLRLTPGHSTAIRALERLYTTQGNVKELIAVLDRETQTATTPNGKVAAYLKLSRLYLEKLNESAKAAQCCESVLTLEPNQLVALKTLERVRASDRTRRAEVRSRIAERVTDRRLKTALRLSAIADGDRSNGAAMVGELKRAYAEDPSDVRLGFTLERALRQSGDFAGLIDSYERRLEKVEDTTGKLELSLRIADLAENRLSDPSRAARYYRLALEQAPALIPALQGARRVAIKLEDWATARSALEAEGRSSRDVRAALEAFVAAGKACEKLKDHEGAVANYRRALERDPLDPQASTGLEELLSRSGDAADIAAMHERRGEAKLAQRDLPAAAAEFLEAAKTWLARANDKERTLAALERALAAQPTNPDALELKANLCLDNQQWLEAATAFTARVAQGGDARSLSAIHLKLGRIYLEQLNDVSRAAAHLQTAIAGDGENLAALELLAGIHSTSRNWTGAADCLRQLVELVQEPVALARHTLALARIMDEGFGDSQQASELYRRALELAPGDPAVIERLVALYERTGNLPELVGVLETQANGAQQAGDLPRSVSLKMRVGEIYSHQLQNPARAIATFRQVTEQDPYSVQAHASLADLYMRDAAAGPLAIQEHLSVLRLDPTRVDSLHALFRLWDGLRQTDKAFCVAGILQFMKAANEVEAAYYNEAKNRLPTERSEVLAPSEIDLLMHPAARTALVEVLRAVGDQLSKLYPPAFETLGIDKRADRLKPDHAVFKAVRGVTHILGVEEFEVYQARRGLVTLETTEPLSICVGSDVIRKFQAREQKFLLARAAMGLVNKTAVLAKLSSGESADLLGNSIRIHQPNFSGLGRRNEDATKSLRRAYSRKALKALEGPALALAGAQQLELKETIQALQYSGDRAGMLLCGDVAIGLQMLLRDDPNFSAVRPDHAEPILQAMKLRDDVRAMLNYVLSEEYFRLRAKIGLAV